MSENEIRRTAIVGTGTIGASWAAYYLARGLEVVATDPAPGAEANLRRFVDQAWPALVAQGLSPGASPDRLKFTPDLKKAVSEAQLIQENAPERTDFKIKLFADIDAASSPEAILASSSSSITVSVMQSGCKRPERVVLGHPFNPPHLIPLVEIVGGTKTSPEIVDRTIAFYRSIGKRPIRLHKEMPGHVANRLQAALYREVLYLIEQKVIDVTDADDAVSWGPGLRWGLMGPSLLFHLAGGAGGMQHFVEHLLPAMQVMWKALGTPNVTPEFTRSIVAGVASETGGRSVEQLERTRDEQLIQLLDIRRKTEGAR